MIPHKIPKTDSAIPPEITNIILTSHYLIINFWFLTFLHNVRLESSVQTWFLRGF
jgi:hypothetical protein